MSLTADMEISRYLSSEPLFTEPWFAERELLGAFQTAVYGYARNNPIAYVDLNGLEPGDPSDSADDAVREADKWMSDDPRYPNDQEFGGWIYRKPDGKYSYTLSSETNGNPGTCDMRPPPGGVEPIASWHNHRPKGKERPTYEDWKTVGRYKVKQQYLIQVRGGSQLGDESKRIYKFTGPPRINQTGAPGSSVPGRRIR